MKISALQESVALGSAVPFAPEVADGSASVTKQILVVDDDECVRLVISRLLRGAGYRVDCAVDGAAAWEELAEKHYDLLVTDHHMPRLTGLELLVKVRSSPPVIPVVFISGLLSRYDRDLTQLIFPGAALAKPFSPSELLSSVRGLLAQFPVQNCRTAVA